MPTDYQTIAQIQALARGGALDAALQRLRDEILQQGEDIHLWRLYAELATDPDDLRFALESILRVNPHDRAAGARLAALGTTPPPYALPMRVKGAGGGDQPTVRLSPRMMRKIGVKPGDFLRVGSAQTTLPVVVDAGETGLNDDELVLNSLAQRMLDVRGGGSVAVVPSESLMLVMDTSASMSNRFGRGLSRLGATKKAINLLLDAKVRAGENDDRVGLVVFETRSRLLVLPTLDYAEVRAAVGGMRVGGATALYQGLQRALDVLKTAAGMKRIILLTDGVPTTSTPGAVLQLAQQGGVIIDTIGMGKPGHRDYDEALLRGIAEVTGGSFRTVDDLEVLEQSFLQLATEKRLLLTE